MARPKKIDRTREVELLDTVYWCGLIKAQSGLSDAQIEKKLNLYVDPTGRKFNRWLNGVRVMTHDQIQTFVRCARKVGLLKSRGHFGSHLDAAAEYRADLKLLTRPSSELSKTLKAIRELHEARRVLDDAVQNFQNVAVALTKQGVDIFDTIKEAPDSFPDDLLEPCNIDAISTRVSEIASWYIFEGRAHGFD